VNSTGDQVGNVGVSERVEVCHTSINTPIPRLRISYAINSLQEAGVSEMGPGLLRTVKVNYGIVGCQFVQDGGGAAVEGLRFLRLTVRCHRISQIHEDSAQVSLRRIRKFRGRHRLKVFAFEIVFRRLGMSPPTRSQVPQVHVDVSENVSLFCDAQIPTEHLLLPIRRKMHLGDQINVRANEQIAVTRVLGEFLRQVSKQLNGPAEMDLKFPPFPSSERSCAN
jgi:hypothetical protein